MKTTASVTRTILACFAAAILLGVTGCASTDVDNASVRPWNSPKSWETGLPSTMTEGR
jgi:hypothetical protein